MLDLTSTLTGKSAMADYSILRATRGLEPTERKEIVKFAAAWFYLKYGREIKETLTQT